MCTNSEIEVKHNDYKVINLQVTYTRIDTKMHPRILDLMEYIISYTSNLM